MISQNYKFVDNLIDSRFTWHTIFETKTHISLGISTKPYFNHFSKFCLNLKFDNLHLRDPNRSWGFEFKLTGTKLRSMLNSWSPCNLIKRSWSNRNHWSAKELHGSMENQSSRSWPNHNHWSCEKVFHGPRVKCSNCQVRVVD